MDEYNHSTKLGDFTYSFAKAGWPPPRYGVLNDRVAAQPFPAQEVKKKVVGGLLEFKIQGSLQGLRVIHGNAKISAGSVIYVRSDCNTTTTWGKQVLSAEGLEFILVPEDAIILVDYTPAAIP